jgi:protein-disulfide isomerase
MRLRYSVPTVLVLICMIALVMGCQSNPKTSDDNSKELLVYVTASAQQVREKALFYGLKVKTINEDTPASQLLQALLNSPTNQYYAVINPYLKRYIAGGAVSDRVNPAELDNQLRQLKQVSKAGVENLGRLHPSSPDHVKLLVFSDFQCPFCKRINPYIDSLKSQYGNKLEVEFVNFPLPMHQFAFSAAEAAECARQQNKFEPYREELFSQQTGGLGNYTYNYIARKLNLDKKEFSQCLSLHQTRKMVRKDQYFGQYMGVSGTPTLILNGENMMGKPPQMIQQEIDTLLKGTPEQSAAAHEDSPPEADQ